MQLDSLFQQQGFSIDLADDGEKALFQLKEVNYDLAVIDIGLPKLDGFDVIRQARGSDVSTPVLILTARDRWQEKVEGLDAGADDYLPKPFPIAEMQARVRALARRAARTLGGAPAPTGADEAAAPPPPAASAPSSPSTGHTAPAPGAPAAGALRVNTASRRVWVGEQELTLTTKEFGVLALLDAERGSVVTRETLMATVWDENWFGSTKTLDVTMGRLRAKLEDAGADVEVVTVRGVGFRLEDDTCAPD